MRQTLRNPTLLACLLWLASCQQDAAIGPAQKVLSYCLEHTDQCALSVDHLTDGWSRDLNADRLQVTASTYKVLTLIAYAEAVAEGRIDPNQTIHRDEWARFWIGWDGGALEEAWNRLDRPVDVTIDEIVNAMMRESDNAAPDWLLYQLGYSALESVVRRYVDGHHDTPQSINATFVSWYGHPSDPQLGLEVANRYTGVEDDAYRERLARLFASLRDDEFRDRVLQFTCNGLPWRPPVPDDCQGGSETPLEISKQLTGRYFSRSTTSTYNRLLAGVLTDSLLPADVNAIVRGHLEYQMDDPAVSSEFARFGQKWGGLSPNDVLTLTTYMQTRKPTRQIVVTVFMQGVDGGSITRRDLMLFTSAVAQHPGFLEELKRRVHP